MRNFDPDSLRALQDLDALGAPERPLSAGELDRLSAAVFARIEKPENEQRPAHPAPARRRRNARRCRTALRALAAAAAAVCACTVTVAAVGPALLKMFSGRIGFFDAAPAATAETADPLDAPRGSYGGAQTRLEAYNAAVGQSVENGGVTMTLDNIAMDVSGMDAFFTVEGNEAIRAILGREGYEPDWDKLRQLFTVGGVTLNGSQTALFCDQTDFYLDESGRLKLWAHYLLNTLPEGDALTVVINAQCNVAPEADPLYGDFQPFTFTVELDGASVRAGGRVAQPGSYDVGQAITIDPGEYRAQDSGGQIPADAAAETLETPLELDYLAFGPLGGTLAARVPYRSFYDGLVEAAQAVSPDMLYITDDTGKELYASCTAGYGEDQRRNVTAPDAAAAAVILTTVVPDGEGTSAAGDVTVTVEEMKNGAKIATSNLGGYTVRNYTVEDHAITYELVPYGWASAVAALNICPNDDGLITMAEDKATLLNGENAGQTVTAYHSALVSSTVDSATGVITVRYDYYAATRAELESIPSFRCPYLGDYKLDEAHAVTLPLEPVA